jgi:hypothetical protein
MLRVESVRHFPTLPKRYTSGLTLPQQRETLERQQHAQNRFGKKCTISSKLPLNTNPVTTEQLP